MAAANTDPVRGRGAWPVLNTSTPIIISGGGAHTIGKTLRAASAAERAAD